MNRRLHHEMGSQTQDYWLPGYRLSRHIVLGQLHYFLGPSASVRPYSYQVNGLWSAAKVRADVRQGREGYLIHGAPLTKASFEVVTTNHRRTDKTRHKLKTSVGSLKSTKSNSQCG